MGVNRPRLITAFIRRTHGYKKKAKVPSAARPRASTDSRHSASFLPTARGCFTGRRSRQITDRGLSIWSGATRCEAMRAAAMRCCASKRSTSTRSEAGAPETPRASPDEGVAAATSAVKASHQSHQKSIRVVDSDDEPAGWPATDPCASDDGAGARTSTSAFAEGCVAVDAREVARSIAAELLTHRAHDRRDVFSVRRSGTVASSDQIVSSDDFEFDPEVGAGEASGGDTVTEPDETTSLLESASCRARRAGTREFGVNTDDDASRDEERRRRRAVTPATAVLLTACAVAGCTLYALDPMNVAGALAGHSWRARAADADPDLAVESAEPTVKAARTKTAVSHRAVSHRAVSHRREEDGNARHVVPRDLFAKALAKALDERRSSGDAPDDDERATSHHAASHRATTKERASRSAHGVAPSRSKKRPDTTREASEKTSGSDASVSRLGHVHRATSHRATSHRATSHRVPSARVVGACAANVPARDARRGRFQFEDASCGGTRHHRGRREGCASVGSGSSLGSSLESGCRFCVLHGSAREDDEDGYDGDDDYLPMLDPLAWSVRYEACPRDVCVTRGLRAALCDPD